MSTTAIEWATHVWNPFTGCDRVSPGCAHCYAIPTAAANQRKELGRLEKSLAEGKDAPTLRYQNDGDPKTSGPGFKFTVHWDKLERPERFPAGARVFVNSMSDVFHEDASDEAIARLWDAFAARPDVVYMVLTKRPERMREFMRALMETGPVPLPNVWCGVTVENRRFVHRADLLRETPAAVRFISAEPLLGPLIPTRFSVVHGMTWPDRYDRPGLDLTGIDWLIAGGESGKDHRPFDPDWARALRDACRATGTAFFMKQLSGYRPGASLEDLPEDLRLRELPKVAVC